MDKNFIKIFFILFLIIVIIDSFLFLIFYKSPKKVLKNFLFTDAKLKKEEFSDIFFKEKERCKIVFPKFSKEIELSLYKARPDDTNKYYLKLFLLKGDENRIFIPEEKIYLSYNKFYQFSDSPTNFWIILKVLNENRVKVEIYADLSLTGKIEKDSFFLTPIQKEKKFIDEKEFLILKKAKWIAPDLFLKLFENKDFGDKQRIIFSLDKEQYQCYFSKGDILIYKEGKWMEEKGDKTKEYSIAKIISFNENSLEIEFWEKDKIGAEKIIIFKKEFLEGVHLQDNFLTDIRIRTKNQISGYLKDKRIVLRDKDILFKKENLWKKISLKNFKKNLMEGEFFIFDSLEKIANGIIFKGYYFNKDRTNFCIIKKNIKARVNNRRKR